MTWYYSYFKTLNALFDILNVGKAIIQEVSSCYNFVVDIVIAETLLRRSIYVTSSMSLHPESWKQKSKLWTTCCLRYLNFKKSFPTSKKAWITLKTNCILFVRQMLEIEVKAGHEQLEGLRFKVVEVLFGNDFLKFKYRKQRVVHNLLFCFQLSGCTDMRASDTHGSTTKCVCYGNVYNKIIAARNSLNYCFSNV